jgi:hypothetical protein
MPRVPMICATVLADGSCPTVFSIASGVDGCHFADTLDQVIIGPPSALPWFTVLSRIMVVCGGLMQACLHLA